MSVVIDGSVSHEKLMQLLQIGHEDPKLDYKEEVNFDNLSDSLELIKDIAAMQVYGGYLVIGASDNGTPTKSISSKLVKILDEASLRAKIDNYLDGNFEIKCASHDVDNVKLGIIFVGQHENGFSIIKKNGSCKDSKDRDKIIFREGDILVRHGTASKRCNQTELSNIYSFQIQKITKRIRKELAQEKMAELNNLSKSFNIQTASSGPSKTLSWEMDSSNLAEIVVEQLRKDDSIPLSLLFAEFNRNIVNLTSDEKSTANLLDNLFALGELFIKLKNADLFKKIIDCYFALYLNIQKSQEQNELKAAASLEIIIRVFSLGGLLVEADWLSAVSGLVLKSDNDLTQYYNNWFRHCLVHASRNRLIGVNSKGGFIQLSSKFLEDWASKNQAQEEEYFTNFLCQFDFLWNIIAFDFSNQDENHHHCPSFTAYYPYRTTPIINKVISNSEIKSLVFKSTNEKLVNCLLELSHIGKRENFFNWDGYRDPNIDNFIEKYLKK